MSLSYLYQLSILNSPFNPFIHSQSVLQTEAAVQRDPTSASAWFLLGVKQQENEREDKAVQALNRALELDPQHGAALLALAVSHTNENDRGGALGAIERWIDIESNGRYADAVRTHRALNGDSTEANAAIMGRLNARQKDLVECLMTMARMSPDGQIDADIQIALGVLLNTSEVSIVCDANSGEDVCCRLND